MTIDYFKEMAKFETLGILLGEPQFAVKIREHLEYYLYQEVKDIGKK